MSSPFRDPLDDFLSRPPSLPVDAALKETLFRKTALPRPRPRRWRRLLAATVAASVLVALVISRLTFRGDRATGISSEPPERQEKVSAAASVNASPDPTPILAAAQPQDLEWRAFDANDDQERARLYFRAGDLYLSAEQDIDAALRCYQQALACADARELRFDPTDNWLVMALKNDLRKEP